MAKPRTLEREISPPPKGRKSSNAHIKGSDPQSKDVVGDDPSLAAIEAGQVEIEDHADYFCKKLTPLVRPRSDIIWHGVDNHKLLYLQNERRHGHHFVIHQHDHPISGVHYDLRLQFSATSTISFAIPYGLPGNPNSARPNRMAIETRVHCLWNSLIESASHATGSLLIWDVGEYNILPWKTKTKPMTDDEDSETGTHSKADPRTDSEKLFAAFQDRHIRLRLWGTRLPHYYTIGLRLPSKNDRSGQPKKPKAKRRRIDPSQVTRRQFTIETDSDTDEDTATNGREENDQTVEEDEDIAIASDSEEISIRENNAYPGAVNSIGSVHQRHWFLSLDRRRSGFKKARDGKWVGPWEPFFVRGRDHERSVITRRNADEVMEDEGVEKFVGRKMWRPILE